ncbi:hypothetical protein WJX79_007975 [Trebouxia sp. C0005]
MLRGSSGHRQATTTSALANIDKLCLRASRDLSRGLDKCYRHNQGSHAKLDEAFRQISVARTSRFENNLAKFSGTALGQIIKAVQGGQVDFMVIDACEDSALCSPLAAALQDFRKDLLQLMAHREASKQEAIQDAVAKTAEEKQKAAAQAESADKEKAEWMQKSRKLQSELHATNLREIAALTSISQLKQDLCAAKRHASDSTWSVSVTQQHAEQHAAGLKEFLGNSEHRAEDADALQQLSVTLKSQLTAETVRALSSNARVVVLDLHLAEIRAEVDKLTAQAAKLDEEQDFKVKLADEKARHLATLQDAAELKSQLQAAKKQLTDEMQAHLASRQALDDTQSQLLDCNTQCLQTGAHGKWAKEKQGEQAFAEAVAAVGHQVAGLGNQVEEAAQRRLSPQQALRSSLYESREGRPEADHASQLTAALRQAHPPAAPQEGVAWAQDVSRRQARHGTPTYPLQQDTSALLDQHDVQQEIQALQQELQETKAALHLAQDSLQKAEATIDCLRKEDEASWQRMNGRHEELLQEIQALKANLSRAGALDQDAYMHDIQDHKNCSEVFDRYGEPVRLAESVMAMGRSHGLPPPTDPSLVRSIIRLNMPPEQLAFHVPRYGLVTTANCKQLMLLLEDRHGEAGLDNQDLGLTLLRAAQSVWVAANLIPWAQYNADLNFLGISGRPPLSPADQRRWFTVISRESLQDPAPLFNGYLAGMMAESKQGDWLNFDNQTQDKVCYACGAEWDGYVEDNGELVDVQLQVVNIHCPTCATYRVPDTGEQKAGDYALCLPCAQTQARVGRCPRTDGVDHELPVTRRTPQFFLKDAANAPPDLPKKKS